MASACVNKIGMSPDNFLDGPATYPSYGWLSPRMSFSRELPGDDSSKVAGKKPPALAAKQVDASELSDPEVSGNDAGDFEFRLDDPVAMLPADELFFDGKLVPLQLSAIRPAVASTVSPEIRSSDTPRALRKMEISSTDPCLFSPKAPRCSSRWKDLLGLKKLYQNNNVKPDNNKTSSSLPSHCSNTSKSLKLFLHRSSKSTSALDSSLSLPLLKDSDSESVSISARLSLSSSSSGHDHEDLSRLSVDSEKPNLSHNTISVSKSGNHNPNPPRVRLVRRKTVSSENPTRTRMGRSPLRRAPDSGSATVRGLSVDSPRMNSSGRVVFQGLERSSSSPSTFNGGPRIKYRGMERSYSANVRVTPVLNVPVCSLRGSSKSSVFGFQLFSSPQKRDSGGSTGNGGVNRGHGKNRTEKP